MNPVGAIVIVSIVLGGFAWAIVGHYNLKFFIGAVFAVLCLVVVAFTFVAIGDFMEKYPSETVIVMFFMVVAGIVGWYAWGRRDDLRARVEEAKAQRNMDEYHRNRMWEEGRRHAFILAQGEVFFNRYGCLPGGATSTSMLMNNVDYEVYEILRKYTLEELEEVKSTFFEYQPGPEDA